MNAFDGSNVHAQAIREAMEQSGIPLDDVWMRYFSFTGTAGEYEIDAYLNGSLDLPAYERDLLAHAVNELINELPPGRKAPYSDSETNPSAECERSQEGNASEDRT